VPEALFFRILQLPGVAPAPAGGRKDGTGDRRFAGEVSFPEVVPALAFSARAWYIITTIGEIAAFSAA